MSNNTDNEKRELLTLEFTDFAEFEATIAAKMVNTHSIAKLINERLQPLFADYRGSYVAPMANGSGVSITLIFNQLSLEQVNNLGPDEFVAFRSTDTGRGNGSIAERSKILLNGMRNGRKFQITDDAANALGVLFRDPKKINWANASGERYEQNGIMTSSCNYIQGLDINRVLEMIYGSKNDDGDKIYYQAAIMSPIGNPQMARINNWLMRVDMMTSSSTQEMCQEAGVISLGDSNCVTGY